MKNNNYSICHYHIFKNAGSSLDEALRKHFRSSWSPFEGTHAHDILSNSDLRIFLNDNPHVEAVSSHLVRPPTPAESILPIVFLRDPLARARSVYEFTRKDPLQPYREHVTSSFSDYLKFALSGSPVGHVIRDYQVIHLSSASFEEPSIIYAKATEKHLEEAIQLLDQWPVIGIVEQYAQSIKLMETVYRQYFPKLKLTYEHENVSPDGLRSQVSQMVKKIQQRYFPKMKLDQLLEHKGEIKSKSQRLRDEIGEELYLEFRNQNELDYRLYEYGRDRLAKLCQLNDIRQ